MGLEIVPQAIHDARENAKLNNIENTEFFIGKAEDILSSVFYKSNNDDVIAIVDPPRAGLRNVILNFSKHYINLLIFTDGKAILQLRKTDKLKKLVYISCNPSAALANFVHLGRPQSKNLFGDPLVPVKAVPVDMFPHTHHCELVIYFERINLDNL